MAIEAWLPLIVVSILLLLIAAAFLFFCYKYLLPVLGVFAAGFFSIVVTSVLDIRYLACLTIAFSTAAASGGGPVIVAAASIMSWYLLILSTLFALVFFGREMSIINTLELIQNYMIEHASTEEQVEVYNQFLETLKFTIGLISLIGSMIAITCLIAGSVPRDVFLEAGFQSRLSFASAYTWSELFSVPGSLWPDWGVQKATGQLDPILRAAQLLYTTVIGAVWFSLIAMAFKSMKRQLVGKSSDDNYKL